MKSLLVHLKDYKKESVLAPLFKMLEASFELFVPLVMAAVIDVGIAQKDRPYIVKMCFVLIALGIIGLVCSITQHSILRQRQPLDLRQVCGMHYLNISRSLHLQRWIHWEHRH